MGASGRSAGRDRLRDQRVPYRRREGVGPGAGREQGGRRDAARRPDRDHQLRSKVDAGAVPALTAFGIFTTTVNAIDPFAGGMSNPDGSIAEYSESQAVLQEGEAVSDIAEEASLVGGVEAGGDVISPAEHALFVQTVDDQRLLEGLGDSPIDWQESPNPYPAVYASPVFKNFQSLEDTIVAGRSGALLPVSPAAWQAGGGRGPGEAHRRRRPSAGSR